MLVIRYMLLTAFGGLEESCGSPINMASSLLNRAGTVLQSGSSVVFLGETRTTQLILKNNGFSRPSSIGFSIGASFLLIISPRLLETPTEVTANVSDSSRFCENKQDIQHIKGERF